MNLFSETSSEDWGIFSVKLCANLLIKSILSSEKLFSMETFPQDLKFRVGKGQDFNEVYKNLLISEDINKESQQFPFFNFFL